MQLVEKLCFFLVVAEFSIAISYIKNDANDAHSNSLLTNNNFPAGRNLSTEYRRISMRERMDISGLDTSKESDSYIGTRPAPRNIYNYGNDSIGKVKSIKAKHAKHTNKLSKRFVRVAKGKP